MSELIITSGSAYVDIDALACSLSLSFLYEKQGVNSKAVHTGALNNTIPDSYKEKVRGLYLTDYAPRQDSKFIVVDVSDPDYFESFVRSEDIEGIYDHHFGFESYWNERIGERSRIEGVGACATLVWELIFQAGLSRDVPPLCLELLCLAIVANTLNFQSNTTSERDRLAISQIEQAGLSVADMTGKYYEEVGRKIASDIQSSIFNDLKTIRLGDGRPVFIGQIEILDSGTLRESWSGFLDEFAEILSHKFCCEDPMWLILVSEVSKGRTLMVSRCEASKSLISSLLPVSFVGDMAIADGFWMRKEVVRELRKA